MRKEDVMICNFPGCLVVCDKSRMEHGDYKEIARISHSGIITSAADHLPGWAWEMLRKCAETEYKAWTDRFAVEADYRPSRLFWQIADRLPCSVWQAVRPQLYRMDYREKCSYLQDLARFYC